MQSITPSLTSCFLGKISYELQNLTNRRLLAESPNPPVVPTKSFTTSAYQQEMQI